MQDDTIYSITRLTINIVTIPQNRFLSVQQKIAQFVFGKLENDLLVPQTWKQIIH